jgi:DNA-binding response OmpR family regulator
MLFEKYRVLLVEDDNDTREMVAFGLHSEGFEVMAIGNARLARRLAREQHFDAYLLDNWLPDGSGVELCRQIRKFDRDTPLIFYSGSAELSDRQEALAAGAQAYLPKPAGIDEVIGAINGVVRVAGNEEATHSPQIFSALIESPPTRPLRGAEDLVPDMVQDVINQTVLAVDDSDDTRVWLKYQLELYGYTVISATDGDEALTLFSRHHPDLVVMDLQMPRLDGLGAAERIRLRSHSAKVPIIAITAFDTAGLKEASLTAGCDDYLVKPLDADTLLRAIKRHLSYFV